MGSGLPSSLRVLRVAFLWTGIPLWLHSWHLRHPGDPLDLLQPHLLTSISSVTCPAFFSQVVIRLEVQD